MINISRAELMLIVITYVLVMMIIFEGIEAEQTWIVGIGFGFLLLTSGIAYMTIKKVSLKQLLKRKKK